MFVSKLEDIQGLPVGTILFDSNGDVRVKRHAIALHDSLGINAEGPPVWAAVDGLTDTPVVSSEELATGMNFKVINLPGRNLISEAKAEALESSAQAIRNVEIRNWLLQRANFFRNPGTIVAQEA